MNFRTTIKPLDHQGLIDHQGAVMMLGSCFSNNVGTRLRDTLFNVDINPFGTLYNPASIASALDILIERRGFCESDLFQYMGRYHSFSHHSDFSGVDSGTVLSRINLRVEEAALALKTASVLIVTFGTAYVFENKETGLTVSNCHKLPADRFTRRRMSVDEIAELWLQMIARLREYNPQLNIVFTVSPIRHLADGAHGNQLSKSTLLLAVERLCKESGAIYFPAYEIMMDDLRDYRFYATDMTHPSEVAVDYVFDLFARSFFSPSTSALATECLKLSKRVKHRCMTDALEAVARFEESTKQMIEKLLQAHPYLERAVKNFKI